MYDIKITTLDDLTISKVNFIKQVSVSFVISFLSSTLTRKKYVKLLFLWDIHVTFCSKECLCL